MDPPPLLCLFSGSHACLKRGGGLHILQISRLISLAGFGQRVPAAHRQALNTEAGVTVAERRWPPPIQNAPASVITNRDYPNVHCMVCLSLATEEVRDRHQWKYSLEFMTWSKVSMFRVQSHPTPEERTSSSQTTTSGLYVEDPFTKECCTATNTYFIKRVLGPQVHIFTM